MGAPNKIYINVHPLGVDYSIVPIPDFGGVEYIRKDALMEWAKENEKRLGDLLTPTNQSLVIGGKLYAYQEFIEKIESL